MGIDLLALCKTTDKPHRTVACPHCEHEWRPRFVYRQLCAAREPDGFDRKCPHCKKPMTIYAIGPVEVFATGG